MAYVPPDDSNIQFGNAKSVTEQVSKPTFEFDPNRSERERLALIATDGSNDPQGGLVKFWSHSSLQQFQECPYRLFLRRVKKIKEPSGEAAERGTKIHDQCEEYVRGLRAEIPEGKKTDQFEHRFTLLKDMFNKGMVQMEENWGFDVDWTPLVDDGKLYKDDKLWAMTKLDVFIRDSETSATVLDYKTGRKFGNEVKHGSQAYTYAISAFMKYPELEFVKAEFWYLDQGQTLERKWTRAEAMLLLNRLTERAIKMTSATKFPAKPGENACRWCHYAKSGDCEYGGVPA